VPVYDKEKEEDLTDASKEVLKLWGGTKSTRYCGHFWPIVQAPDGR
jgi:hypothetical protein